MRATVGAVGYAPAISPRLRGLTDQPGRSINGPRCWKASGRSSFWNGTAAV